MSSSDRRKLLTGLAGFAMLAGCGFSPVYGPGGQAEGLRGLIRTDPPADAQGYTLVRRIEERLGRPENPAFGLSASVLTEQAALAVTPDQETTRYQLRGTMIWSLTRIADGASAASGTLHRATAYSAPVFSADRGSIAGNTVSVLTAEQDARRRLMVILADDLVSHLLATAPDWQR
ncbi:LPS assembly lipoprotein LptE [Profundibacterium mesophilum]|uniref:Secreted periplasmic protein n=1 Tax=Profundibacterium mesophilum KAUST100406-0324 TaxID=1037889 RepID=A0A921NXG0_9RHOB|nr:LPS assembly lipoprotein LptE [Profundibacterium mesophilum]KAF0676524.1 putative secreted periplasmic protein [Profundibacterium mesophilum KAUST100406-0324]